MLGQKFLLALVASILSPGVLAAPHDLSNQLMKRDPSSTLSVYNALSVPSVKRADSADAPGASKEEASKEKDSKEAEKESKEEASKEKDSKKAEKDNDSKGEASKGEDSKGEAPKGEDSKGEAPKGEDSQGEAPKGEDSQGEAPKSEDSKGEASTASTPAAAPDAATDAAGNPFTQVVGDITSLDPLAVVGDLAAPVAGALPVKA